MFYHYKEHFNCYITFEKLYSLRCQTGGNVYLDTSTEKGNLGRGNKSPTISHFVQVEPKSSATKTAIFVAVGLTPIENEDDMLLIARPLQYNRLHRKFT